MRSVRFQKGNLISREREQEATTWYHVRLIILGYPWKGEEGKGGGRVPYMDPFGGSLRGWIPINRLRHCQIHGGRDLSVF